jgi:hypothetical protein
MNDNRFYKSLILITITSLTIFSCDIFNLNPGNRYSSGRFQSNPVNLKDFNSGFDDFNSDIPIFGETFPFCFSSNRNSNGADFDIIYKLMSVEFSKKTGELKVYENTHSNLDVFIRNENINEALLKINSSGDEYGPCLIPIGNGNLPVGSGYQSFQNYIFLYANNESGNQNIKLTHNTLTNRYDTIHELNGINSDTNDFYPALNSERTKIYWSSDREGNFSIYYTEIDRTEDILSDLINAGKHNILKDDVLSSDGDDKCPSIANNILVFTSNRAGGFGGYDLYYSYFENGKWSRPVNFGNKINTEYDEYRPIVRSDEWQFDNDMLIFSSNRPGGKGGFDLYFVGIPWK